MPAPLRIPRIAEFAPDAVQSDARLRASPGAGRGPGRRGRPGKGEPR